MNKISDEKKQKILEAIELYPNNMSAAARYAEVPFKTFVYRAKTLGIYAPNQGQGNARREARKLLDWTDCSLQEKRRRVLEEQNNKCLHCNKNKWMGQQLTLELDHIDGNNQNNERKNLRFLCPNCHSLTPTFRNNLNPERKISNEEFCTALQSHSSIRAALLSLGLTPKAGNYSRAKKLKKHMRL